jgi:hypothetical protein
MSLSLVIAVNVVADLALIGLLAFVMSRASVLSPHASAVASPARPRLRARRQRPARPAGRSSTAPLSAHS